MIKKSFSLLLHWDVFPLFLLLENFYSATLADLKKVFLIYFNLNLCFYE